MINNLESDIPDEEYIPGFYDINQERTKSLATMLICHMEHLLKKNSAIVIISAEHPEGGGAYIQTNSNLAPEGVKRLLEYNLKQQFGNTGT